MVSAFLTHMVVEGGWNPKSCKLYGGEIEKISLEDTRLDGVDEPEDSRENQTKWNPRSETETSWFSRKLCGKIKS